MTMWYSAVGCIVTVTLSLLTAPLAADAQQPAKIPGVVRDGSRLNRKTVAAPQGSRPDDCPRGGAVQSDVSRHGPGHEGGAGRGTGAGTGDSAHGGAHS